MLSKVPRLNKPKYIDDISYSSYCQDLLSNSTLGLYISNSAKAAETKELIDNLAQQALQYQKVEFSDIISVVEQDSIIEAKEALKASEERRQFEEKMEQMKQQTAKEEGERLREFQREQFEMEKELIVLKEEEKENRNY